jgi:hypothetical protein
LIFLSLHGDDLKTSCMSLLSGYGYTFRQIEPMEIVALPPRK